MENAVRRVAITGMGVVSPLGSELGEFADGLLAGESAAAPITVFDASHLPTRIGAEARLAAGAIALKDRKIALRKTQCGAPSTMPSVGAPRSPTTTTPAAA